MWCVDGPDGLSEDYGSEKAARKAADKLQRENPDCVIYVVYIPLDYYGY